jgi:hypothetical protein
MAVALSLPLITGMQRLLDSLSTEYIAKFARDDYSNVPTLWDAFLIAAKL